VEAAGSTARELAGRWIKGLASPFREDKAGASMKDWLEVVYLTEARPDAWVGVALEMCFAVSSLAWWVSDALFFNPCFCSPSCTFYSEDSFSEEAYVVGYVPI